MIPPSYIVTIQKKLFTKHIPVAAAAIPPTLLIMKYLQAFANSRRPIMFTTSTEYVENVAK